MELASGGRKRVKRCRARIPLLLPQLRAAERLLITSSCWRKEGCESHRHEIPTDVFLVKSSATGETPEGPTHTIKRDGWKEARDDRRTRDYMVFALSAPGLITLSYGLSR